MKNSCAQLIQETMQVIRQTKNAMKDLFNKRNDQIIERVMIYRYVRY